MAHWEEGPGSCGHPKAGRRQPSHHDHRGAVRDLDFIDLSFDAGGFVCPQRWERVSREPLGSALSNIDVARHPIEGGHAESPSSVEGVVARRLGDVAPAVIAIEPDPDPEAEAKAFVRFCYRRRAVAWPELYDEMCAVAARRDYRGMDYEELQGLGIGFALSALPRLAQLAAHVIAEEHGPHTVVAIA